jgi:hypothetical protein
MGEAKKTSKCRCLGVMTIPRNVVAFQQQFGPISGAG